MRTTEEQSFSRLEVSVLTWAPLMDSTLLVCHFFGIVLLFFCGGKTSGMEDLTPLLIGY